MATGLNCPFSVSRTELSTALNDISHILVTSQPSSAGLDGHTGIALALAYAGHALGRSDFEQFIMRREETCALLQQR